MFLRELEGEVPENVAPGLLTARPLQRDFRILISLQLAQLREPEKVCFGISNPGYSVAANAAHK